MGSLLVRWSSADLGYDYYDINDVFDAFEVDCGTFENRHMVILYGGNARKVYASAAPIDCAATEVAPAVWRIDIEDFTNTNCPVSVSNDPEVVQLEVVVQMNSVRTYSDKLRQITCNYGLNGQQNTALTDTEAGTLVQAHPVWESANSNTTNTTVTMKVYGTDNSQLSTAYLGNYIQLRAFMYVESGEQYSLRMYNCRAYDSTMSYYLLMGGCGQGTVLDENRGFRTKSEAAATNQGAFRVSRSSYFKTFLMPSDDTNMQFECDYVICDSDDLADCDTYSCSTSQQFSANGRKKRAAKENAIIETGLPTVHTSTLTILPRPEDKGYTVGSELLITDKQTGGMPLEDFPTKRMNGLLREKEEDADDDSEDFEDIVFGLDTLTLSLIVVFVVLTTVVLILACLLLCCRKSPLEAPKLMADDLHYITPRKF